MTDFEPRTTTQDALRRKLAETQHALNVEREARIRAEIDARTLSEFINQRVGCEVWDHRDVVAVLYASFVRLGTEMLSDIRQAQHKGVPPTYMGFQRFLTGRYERIRADLISRIDADGSASALSVPTLVSDRMREDVGNVTRLKDAA